MVYLILSMPVQKKLCKVHFYQINTFTEDRKLLLISVDQGRAFVCWAVTLHRLFGEYIHT